MKITIDTNEKTLTVDEETLVSELLKFVKENGYEGYKIVSGKKENIFIYKTLQELEVYHKYLQPPFTCSGGTSGAGDFGVPQWWL